MKKKWKAHRTCNVEETCKDSGQMVCVPFAAENAAIMFVEGNGQFWYNGKYGLHIHSY